jgi:putative transcriptional regulator
MRRDYIETLPARLRELRAAAGLTQAELAERAGVLVTDVSRYETGARTPGLRVAGQLADALGCSLDALREPAEGEKRGRGRPKKNPAD